PQISRQGLKNPDPLRTEAMVDSYPEDTIGSYQLSHSIQFTHRTGTRRHRPTIWPAIPGARPVLGRRVLDAGVADRNAWRDASTACRPSFPGGKSRVEGLHRGAYLRNQMLGHGRLLPLFWICEVANVECAVHHISEPLEAGMNNNGRARHQPES